MKKKHNTKEIHLKSSQLYMCLRVCGGILLIAGLVFYVWFSSYNSIIEDEGKASQMISYVTLCAEDSDQIYTEKGADFILRSQSDNIVSSEYDIVRKDDSGKVLCKYDDSGRYEPVLLSWKELDNEQLPLLKLYNEFPAQEYAYLTTSYYEGLSYAPLWRVGVNVTNPVIEKTGFMIPNRPDFAVNESKDMIILFLEEKRNQLYLFDVRTGENEMIHEIDSSQYTYFSRGVYGDAEFRVEWIDNETCIIRAVSLEKHELFEDILSIGVDKESVYDELRKTGDLIEVVIDTKDFLL
ncbi:MAG: hypothetical protein H8D63_00500 [Parcubacteria group bacterium]|nr:hypothetical protein [Parcubacteria group bacterium]